MLPQHTSPRGRHHLLVLSVLAWVLAIPGPRSEGRIPPEEEVLINPTRAGEVVSPLLFGSNLEHTRYAVWKGLGAELLANRKFAGVNIADGRNSARIARAQPGPDGVVARWHALGTPDARFAADKEVAYCGLQSQRIDVGSVSGRGGLRQQGIALEAGRDYLVRLQIKSSGHLRVRTRLSDGVQTQYAQEETQIEPGAWREWSTRFTAPQTNQNAALEVSFEGPGTLWLGAASLLPANHFHGMRRDVIERLREMTVPLLRWPGGNFTRDYRWKEGLLPIDRRPPIAATWAETLPFTDNYDFHDIGVDEFIALCRELGAEPSITLSLRDGGDADAADLVEYCNGAASTVWGRRRAENGHPEPYGVKYWSIGNEVYGKWMYPTPYTADSYAETVRKYSSSMRRVDASIVVIAAGLDPSWDKTLVQKSGAHFDWLARHEYPPETAAFTGVEGAAEYFRQIRRAEEFVRPWLAEARREMDSLGESGKKVGLSFDEWNVWHKWFTRPDAFEWHVGPTEGAFLAALLNMFCREASNLNLRMAAIFQPVNEGAIRVSPFTAELTAMGQVFALYGAHHGGRLLPLPSPKEGDSLDICATLAANNQKVHLTVVNRTPEPRALTLQWEGRSARGANATILKVANLQPDIPFERAIQDLPVGNSGALRVTAPPLGVVRVDVSLSMEARQ